MIEILRDEQENIKAVCEWWIVSKDGIFNPQGKYVWINECAINPEYQNNGIIKTFISKVITKAPQVEYGYFKRRKYGDRIKMFKKSQWLNRLSKQ